MVLRGVRAHGSSGAGDLTLQVQQHELTTRVGVRVRHAGAQAVQDESGPEGCRRPTRRSARGHLLRGQPLGRVAAPRGHPNRPCQRRHVVPEPDPGRLRGVYEDFVCADRTDVHARCQEQGCRVHNTDEDARALLRSGLSTSGTLSQDPLRKRSMLAMAVGEVAVARLLSAVLAARTLATRGDAAAGRQHQRLRGYRCWPSRWPCHHAFHDNALVQHTIAQSHRTLAGADHGDVQVLLQVDWLPDLLRALPTRGRGRAVGEAGALHDLHQAGHVDATRLPPVCAWREERRCGHVVGHGSQGARALAASLERARAPSLHPAG
mmetsp:Transcript_99650/g.309873  ORF Transcript_99650/g.309873 Transcript_99650/m.309873 type:complete len:321 (-) Transcript_99650:124-1086(-)